MNPSIRNPSANSPRKIVLTLLAAAMIGALGAANAGAAMTTEVAAAAANAPSVTVRFGDLNVASEAGARALYQRLVAAAHQVCPDDSGSFDLAKLRLDKACRDQAVLRAARQIPSPQLAAIVAGSIKAS
jgi:UrcA family protein